MKRNLVLHENQGIPAALLFGMAFMAALSVANIYYCQPLLALMATDLGISEWQASLIAMITQAGYASGLFFLVPSGDKFDRKAIAQYCFIILTIVLLYIYISSNYIAIMTASFIVGVCSVMPQIFIPIAAQYSTPQKKDTNVGIIVSGLLVGILASRVISGVVGDLLRWRSMYIIASTTMALCFIVISFIMPRTEINYNGTYRRLMSSLISIIREYKLLRICSLRAAFAFGSFLALWASLTFRMGEAPFFDGSEVVGLLGLCGVAGALAATFVGRYVSRFGLRNFNFTGVALLLAAWVTAYIWDNSYIGIITAIILLDIGMQCIQLSNQATIFSLNAKASSRINTVFMTCYFVGGSIGTLLSGTAWSLAGWGGVAATGIFLALCSFAITILSKE